LNLNQLDIIATLVAAICHDFKHNGLNNMYHMNISSEIAITYNGKIIFAKKFLF